MKHILHTATLSVLSAVAIVSAESAIAQPGTVPSAAAPATIVNNRGERPMAQAAWSNADFATARPMLPKVGHLPSAVFDYNAAVNEAMNAGAQISADGGRGGADASLLREMRNTGPVVADVEDDEIGTQAVGTLGRHFTSTRTFPNSSDTTYPTRTVGKLYFRDPATNLNYVCSGSMIKRGVVLTSGHCIHNGVNRFYTDFVFVPGLRNAVRPYGTWSNWVQGRTTTEWVTGGGGVPNVADWATIVFGPNASGYHIGAYTGWLGYTTNFCSGKHLSTLGYPQNLDSGLQMQKSDSQSTSYGSLNNCTWGTDMRGGSSGGPIVLNLEVVSANSSPAPLENNPNRVVSTVSWGYTSTAPHVQGGSILSSTFLTLLNNTCAANPTACQ